MRDNEIAKGLFIFYEALFIKSEKALVVADLHLGIEDALHKEGALIPRTNFNSILKKLTKILEKINKNFSISTLEYLIINGDLKHEFGEISKQEWQETLAMIDFLASKTKRLILVKGNHDTILGPIAKKRNLEILDYFSLNSFAFAHGHKIIEPAKIAKAEILVIAHEHPAAVLSDGVKNERYKCFLLGKYRRKKLIVMPAISALMHGSNILSETLLSPYLQKANILNFEVWLLAEKPYYFGKVKNLYDIRPF
ncbi:MAG: metallophosphoesterase [Candidatus Diapherotrites archaeon]|nr:metallophosphoesterase [Candidatus Diapherotrites archaeon]